MADVFGDRRLRDVLASLPAGCQLHDPLEGGNQTPAQALASLADAELDRSAARGRDGGVYLTTLGRLARLPLYVVMEDGAGPGEEGGDGRRG